jgi:hypothetical protein
VSEPSVRVLHELQRALESVYRVAPGHDVRDFVIGPEARNRLGLQRAPREQLLLREAPGELEVGLFVDPATLAELERGLDEANLQDFLFAVEGVSHFLYVMVRAQSERPFSALELELQAEVDKYLLALLVAWAAERRPPEGLRARLFDHVRFADDLSAEERERYATAHQAADGYAASLEARYVRHRALDGLLGELRRFYRLGCAAKLDHIARQAA